MAYAWLTFVQARTALADRLADPTNQFWGDAECGAYIVEALRTWNSLTFAQKQEFVVTVPAGSNAAWIQLGSLSGSPRARTLTNTFLYVAMQYHLLEPATGNVWTGTSQFSVAGLMYSLQLRRDEVVQATNCNCAIISIPSEANRRRVALPDSVLEVERVRWIAGAPDPLTAAQPPITLFRTDAIANSGYQPTSRQTEPGSPSEYDIASGPPLSLDVDVPPSVSGAYEILANQSAPDFALLVDSYLAVPDDYAWVLKWGALASLFGRESEATDPPREAYCMKRYTDGIELMRKTPWIESAFVDDVPAELASVAELDGYQPEWDSFAGSGVIATAGIDTLAIIPDATQETSVTLTVLGNAVVPINDGDFIQVSRDTWGPMLDYAQFLAAFKQGGAEFQSALALESRFFRAAMEENSRLQALGLFSDVLLQRAGAQEREQERYVGKDGE